MLHRSCWLRCSLHVSSRSAHAACLRQACVIHGHNVREALDSLCRIVGTHPVHGTFVLSCNCSCLTSFWTQRSQSLHWILMHQPTPTFTSFPIQHRLDASSLQPLSYLFSSLLSPRNTCLHIFNMTKMRKIHSLPNGKGASF